jgi:hypothetical protein
MSSVGASGSPPIRPPISGNRPASPAAVRSAAGKVELPGSAPPMDLLASALPSAAPPWGQQEAVRPVRQQPQPPLPTGANGRAIRPEENPFVSIRGAGLPATGASPARSRPAANAPVTAKKADTPASLVTGTPVPAQSLANGGFFKLICADDGNTFTEGLSFGARV